MGEGLTAKRAAAYAALAACLAHVGCLFAGLVYDDQQLMGSITARGIVGGTPFLADAGSIARLFSPEWYFQSSELSWRPLTVALHILQRNLLGLPPLMPLGPRRDPLNQFFLEPLEPGENPR